MPFSQVINYDTPGNFSFDSTKVGFVSGKAKLKLTPNPGQMFNQDFSSDSGFTYDSNLVEFVAGIMRQKNQNPTDSVLGALFSTSVNANWTRNNLSTTATLLGSPAISGGKFDFNGPNTGLYFQNNDIGLASSTGEVRKKFTPSYSGTPDVNAGFISFSDPSAPSGANNLLLYHSASNGAWRITARDNSNVSVHSAQIIGPAWSPVAGTEYEIALAWDVGGGGFGFRLFINGVLHGTLASTFTRGTSATRLYVGSNATYAPGRGAMRDLVVYDADQHTTGYTPGYTLPAFKFLASVVVAPPFTYTGVGTILSVEQFNITEMNGVRYTVAGKWFNGSAWVPSNGTYAEANTSAEIMANITSLVVAGAGSAPYSIYFTDSNVQGSVDEIDLELTGQIYPTDNPTVVNSLGSQINADELFSFIADAVAAGSDAVKFALIVGGVDKYWNGSAWANSSGYAQSNTASDINTNIGSLDLSAGFTIRVKAYLHSDTGQTTPELTSVTFSYDFFAFTPDDPARCIVYAFLRDMIGFIKDTPQQAKLIVETIEDFDHGENIVGRYRRVFKFDSEGYVETTPAFLEVADASAKDGLIESQTIAKFPYQFTIQYRNSDGKLMTLGVSAVQVPNQVSKNLVEFLDL